MQINLPQPTPVTATVDPTRSALVIVDMENEFLKPGYPAYVGAEASDRVIATVARLRERARTVGIPILYVQSVRTPETPDHAVFGRPHHLIEGTWGSEYVDELRPEPGATIVKKYTHDCWVNTELEATLEGMGIRPMDHRVIVCGIAAGTCVNHAVLGFHVRHYWTVVPIDCIEGEVPYDVPWALYRWSRPAYSYNITLTTSDLLTLTPLEAAAPVR